MGEYAWLPRDGLGALLDALKGRGYDCIGPRIRDGAILFEPLETISQLPWGASDRQGPGFYRLADGNERRAFHFANGPQALKPLLFAPREALWRVVRNEGGRLAFEPIVPQAPPRAVLGVRACDLAALAIHDAHFMKGAHGAQPDLQYAARREGLFLVAVNCAHPSATCFCASTGDGPEVRGGFDLLLDEMEEGFLVRPGSGAGGEVLAALGLGPASEEAVRAARRQLEHVARCQTRGLPGRNLQDALFQKLEHPHWEEVAKRCLSCGNCANVCPTCFCHTHEEAPELDGASSRHYRAWDTCFSPDHSYLHGFMVRADTPKRYRQWLTHKLGSWHEQFGRSGCVGCGRCITWCPAGIDITEAAGAILEGGQ